MEGVTLVTAFFDLSSRDTLRHHYVKCETDSNRTVDGYLAYGNNLLKLDVNLFIVADPHIILHCWKMRKKYQLLDKSYFYPIQLEDLPYYKHRVEIEKAFASGKKPTDVWNLGPLKFGPLYLITVWSKFWCINQSTQLNPFSSEQFIWVDFGIYHIRPENRWAEMGNTLKQIIKAIPPDKIRSLVIRETDPKEMEDKTKYYSHRVDLMAGGLICGPKDKMEWLCKEFDQELKTCLEVGYPTTEETILNVVYTTNKAEFKPYYGHYRDVIFSYFNNQSTFEHILKNLEYCRDHKLWTEALQIGKDVAVSLDNNKLTPSLADTLRFYDEMLISEWYSGKQDGYTRSKEMADKIVKIYQESNKNKKTINVAHFNHNLAIHGLKITQI